MIKREEFPGSKSLEKHLLVFLNKLIKALMQL